MPAQGLLSIPTFLRPKGMGQIEQNRRKGFTLIELMVVITIIAILSSVGYVTYSNSQAVARDARRRMDLRSLVSALELYYQQNNGVFPTQSPAINSTQTAGPWQLSLFLNNDINQLPIDPINSSPYYYSYYSADGSSYILCATLEKPQPSDLTNNANCHSVVNSIYQVNSAFEIDGSAF